MKKMLIVLSASLVLFCSCEKPEELSDAVAFNKIPDTNIAETQLGTTVYTYSDLVTTTAGVYYDMDAVYDCYKKDGEVYYVMNRRDAFPDNANQLVGMEGFLPSMIQIHDGYYAWTGGEDNETHLYSYDFDESSQTLEGVCKYHIYADAPNTLIYLSEEYFVLQMDVTWRNLSKEKGATFSRVVYKKCLAPDFSAVTDTIDYRK